MKLGAIIKAWEGVVVEMSGQHIRARQLYLDARTHADRKPHSEFNSRCMEIADDAEALSAVYLALAEHARAELAKLQPTMQGEKVKP